LALQNKEEGLHCEGGKPSLITLLKFDSPPQRPKTFAALCLGYAVVPLSNFANTARTSGSCKPDKVGSFRKALYSFPSPHTSDELVTGPFSTCCDGKLPGPAGSLPAGGETAWPEEEWPDQATKNAPPARNEREGTNGGFN